VAVTEAVGLPGDGSVHGTVGVADGRGAGSAAPLGVRVSSLPGVPVGAEAAGEGEGHADGVGAAGLLTGGGARGTEGDAGVLGVARWSGSAMRAAAAQDRPTPAAARRSLRRAAAGGIAS
jgi:hypothetical protein